MPYNKSGQSVRSNYEIAKATLAQAGISAKTAKLTQHTLRLEALLTTSATQYQFGVLVNQQSPGASGSSFNTEVKLNLQDSFFVHEIGVFIANPSSATATGFRLLTYPDSLVFTTSGVPAATQALYNGNISLSVDNDTIVPNWDLIRHNNIPNPNSYAVASGQNPPMTSGFDGTTQGLAPVEPMWILNGKQNINLRLNLQSALAAAETNQRVVVLLRGHLAQNVGINLNLL
jgi:hypothetical protein